MRNRFPDSDSQDLVEGVAGMFLAEVQRMKGTEEVGNLSVGKRSLAAVLMFEGMDKSYKMKLRDTGKLR